MVPKYRADIDGLRAVAVLTVFLFHAGSSLFSGGYVGVDVFFVISGFLITTIIVREIEGGRFSIARFYERRFRRILPALAVVLAFCLGLGIVLLTPGRLVGLGQSAMAAALFSSNLLFYAQAGYFDGPAESKPLLHTWSLAIEEQYYIFFPLLLILIARFGRRRYAPWLAGLGALSFLCSVVVTRIDASAAFYLIPTRAWELFTGSLLALRVVPVPRARWARETVAAVGLGLIGVASVMFTPATAFPGAAAALPVLGAALVIHAGSGGSSQVSRLLSLPAVVFVGLISYSLYLWHWPLIVFMRIYTIGPPTPWQTGVMALLAFALAYLSWRYVETPFRTKRLLPDMAGVMRGAAATLLVVLCSGSALLASDGLPQRFGHLQAAADPEWRHWGTCQEASVQGGSTLCTLGRRQGPAVFMLWGDSHARALASGVDRSADRHGVKGLIATFPACPPLLGIERPGRAACEAFNRRVLDRLARSPQIGTVVLAARWALSAEGTRYGTESGKPVRLVDLDAPHDAPAASNAELFRRGLIRTVTHLQRLGKAVVIIGAVPEVGHDVPSASFAARVTGRDMTVIAPTLADYRQRTRAVQPVLATLAAHGGATLIDPSGYLCAAGHCAVVADGAPLYRDDNHLSTFGSQRLAPVFDPLFARMAAGRGAPVARPGPAPDLHAGPSSPAVTDAVVPPRRG